ncbi:MAG: peroxiredoxin [Candidatus Micrarchaeia archaeon]
MEKELHEGDSAPEFELEGNDGKKHTLNEFKGKYLVIYFYPKDNTPGCTAEACAFRDSTSSIRQAGAEVIGISKDSIDSHKKFAGKHELNFLLLSDPESKTIKAYGAYGNKGVFGFGTLRKTYIIDKSGKVAKVLEKIKPEEHAAKAIEFLKSQSR